jgi:D-beta-D-heptose 7-phosphate kinase/D-beta-D-heptose 1-phosphate adenosyltransferase
LASVDAVYVFPELRVVNLLTHSRPDVYVKGGDYTLETIPQDERQAAEQLGARIVFLAHVPGKSTSATLSRIERVQ